MQSYFEDIDYGWETRQHTAPVKDMVAPAEDVTSPVDSTKHKLQLWCWSCGVDPVVLEHPQVVEALAHNDAIGALQSIEDQVARCFQPMDRFLFQNIARATSK